MPSEALISYSLPHTSDRARAAFKKSLQDAGWMNQEQYYNAGKRELPETTLIIPYADPAMIKRDLDKAVRAGEAESSEITLYYVVSKYEKLLFEAPPKIPPVSALFKDI